MSIFDKEEVVAPTQQAAVAAATKVECTRDTRGDAPCAVKDCENCN
jgi:hypothetical protein